MAFDNDSEALTSLEDVDAIDADMEARACARIAALTHAPSADAEHLSLSCLVSLFTTISSHVAAIPPLHPPCV